MSAQPARSPLHLVAERPPGPGLTDFALWLRANGCNERTISDRILHLGDFTRSNPSFPNVAPMQITAWIGREGYAAQSRASYYGHLRSYFNFALENELLTVDPMARMRRPKKGHGLPRPLKPEQVDLLLSRAKPDMRTRLILGLYAGLRAHEIAKIRGEDVTEDTIYVLGKGAKAAEIPAHPIVWAEAQNRPRVGFWFPSNTARGHVTTLTVSTGTSIFFSANGIEGSVHRCRHTYATRLLRAGVNVRVVQELMRHESLASTMLYCAVDEDELRDGISRLDTCVVAEAPAVSRKLTRCDKGHEFTEGNIYLTPDGRRMCRTCRQDRQAGYDLARKSHAKSVAAVASPRCDEGHELTDASVSPGHALRQCRTCAQARFLARKRRTKGVPVVGLAHCGQGHEFTGANTYVAPDGRRQCRACSQARYLTRKARIKDARDAAGEDATA